MKVLSLFDGIACGYMALERAGITVDAYHASEIDKYAMSVSEKRVPNIVHLGDIKKLSFQEGDYDLVMGGSPCQGLSFAGKQLNFSDPRSSLFFEFIRILGEVKPKYFLLENVPMSRSCFAAISEMLGGGPRKFNSKTVSAQSRERLYWSNIPGVTKPEDKNIKLEDILFSDALPICVHNIYGGFKEKTPRVTLNKSPTLRAQSGGGAMPFVALKSALEKLNLDFDGLVNYIKTTPYKEFKSLGIIRPMNPIECERLQTLPDNYTHGLSNSKRYKLIGNGWNVDTVAHIFSFMEEGQ